MYIEAPRNIKRVRKVSCLEVENATFSWFTMMHEHGATMTNDLLTIVAKKFYSMSQGYPSHMELHFPREWLEGFKRRFNIKGYTSEREATSTNNSPETMQCMEVIKLICLRYNILDIFNTEETWPFIN